MVVGVAVTVVFGCLLIVWLAVLLARERLCLGGDKQRQREQTSARHAVLHAWHCKRHAFFGLPVQVREGWRKDEQQVERLGY